MANKRHARDTRDQAGVGPDVRQVRHLRPLSELKKIKIASGEPDIRGWHVFTSTGREVGEVNDLLVDTTIGQVVMLDLDIDGTDRRSLAPIRSAWIDREHKRVVLDAAQIKDDDLFPSISRDDATDEDWQRFDDSYRRAYGHRGFDEESDWELRHRDDDMRFGRRRTDRDRDGDGIDDAEEYRVERHRADAEHRARLEREYDDREVEPRDVHYDADALRPDRGMIVEEHVVRRRVVDPDQLDEPRR
jgi:hypothetical protein